MNKIIGKINVLILSVLMIVIGTAAVTGVFNTNRLTAVAADDTIILLSLIHISEPTRH